MPGLASHWLPGRDDKATLAMTGAADVCGIDDVLLDVPAIEHGHGTLVLLRLERVLVILENDRSRICGQCEADGVNDQLLDVLALLPVVAAGRVLGARRRCPYYVCLRNRLQRRDISDNGFPAVGVHVIDCGFPMVEADYMVKTGVSEAFGDGAAAAEEVHKSNHVAFSR